LLRAVTSHLAGMQSAAKMLAARVRVLHEYVSAVCAGTVPHDHALLREIAALLRQLPAVEPATFERDYLTEVNDTLLMSYLTAMTKGTAQIGELADRLNAVHGDKQSRRATRSFF
jgi:COP9 signalosome complex subunit 6